MPLPPRVTWCRMDTLSPTRAVSPMTTPVAWSIIMPRPSCAAGWMSTCMTSETRLWRTTASVCTARACHCGGLRGGTCPIRVSALAGHLHAFAATETVCTGERSQAEHGSTSAHAQLALGSAWSARGAGGAALRSAVPAVPQPVHAQQKQPHRERQSLPCVCKIRHFTLWRRMVLYHGFRHALCIKLQACQQMQIR